MHLGWLHGVVAVRATRSAHGPSLHIDFGRVPKPEVGGTWVDQATLPRHVPCLGHTGRSCEWLDTVLTLVAKGAFRGSALRGRRLDSGAEVRSGDAANRDNRAGIGALKQREPG